MAKTIHTESQMEMIRKQRINNLSRKFKIKTRETLFKFEEKSLRNDLNEKSILREKIFTRMKWYITQRVLRSLLDQMLGKYSKSADKMDKT